MSRLFEKIVDNIQVEVSNVHIRYEDSTDPNVAQLFQLARVLTIQEPFSMGITLERLDVFSVDDNWKKAFLDKEHTIIHKVIILMLYFLFYVSKLFLLQNLALYVNTGSRERSVRERLYMTPEEAKISNQLTWMV